VVHGPQVGVCRVCGEMTDTFSNAECMQCGAAFHLALRQDIPAKDCGQVWINDDAQSLEFACDLCLGRVAEPAAPEPLVGERTRYARRQGTRAAEVLRAKRRKG
jgi:hypothetical protein